MRIGANIAGAGASGLTVGSFGDILQQNAALEELDVMNIKQQGALRRAGFVNEANLRSAEASSASRAGMIGAASKLLSGSAKFF